VKVGGQLDVGGNVGEGAQDVRRAAGATGSGGEIQFDVTAQLGAAATLARVLAERNARHMAVDLLAPIYGRVTEGFDTVDLKEAKALLDELT
jgi:hypothetical protein